LTLFCFLPQGREKYALFWDQVYEKEFPSLLVGREQGWVRKAGAEQNIID
jgi:hypothetical protein